MANHARDRAGRLDNVYLRHAASLSSSANFRLGFVGQTRRQSRRLLCADGFYSSSLEELGRFLYRGQRQQLLHFAVCKDDVGGALQCLIVTPFISVTEF